MDYSSKGSTTKHRILECAATLFAEKGFTETSVRELADAVGLKGASIYNHFSSKNHILEYMLEDFSVHNTDVFAEKNIASILRENPTADGILDCLQLSFPPERQEYYLKVLCVLLQEQLRNPMVKNYMAEYIVLRAERNTKKIIDMLKELNIIRHDADPQYYMEAVSSLLYSFSARMMLGIGDAAPNFTGIGMVGMLRQTFDLMLEKYGIADQSPK